MSQYSKPLQLLVWGFLFVIIVAIGVAFYGSLAVKNLQSRKPLPVIGPVGSFTLTNQMGRVVTQSDLLGKVWVADIIFSRCPGPCAKMTRKMAELQNLVRSKSVQFVSLTTDPLYDSPEILKRYAESHGADFSRWWFLTGPPAEIKRLATGGLKLAAVEKSPAERESENDLFIHSTIFVIVDKQGRLRGSFELDDDNAGTMAREIAAAVKRLLREP